MRLWIWAPSPQPSLCSKAHIQSKCCPPPRSRLSCFVPDETVRLTSWMSKHRNLLLRFLLRPHTPKAFPLLRSFSAESTQPQEPNKTIITEAVNLLKTPRAEWDQTKLTNLLFPTSSSSTTTPPSPRLFFDITRRLPSSSQALYFLHYLRNDSHCKDDKLLSSALQAIFELASRENPDPGAKLLELYNTSKELNIPLTVNAAALLIRVLGRRGLVDDSVGVFSELGKSVKNRNVYNVIVEVLMSNGRAGNALQVLDEMLQRGSEYPPDKFTGDIVFYSWSKRKQWLDEGINKEDMVALVLRFGDYGVFPDSIWIAQLINGLCRSGKVDVAWDLVCGLMNIGANVEVACFNALLTGLGRVRDLQRMNELMMKMEESDIKPNAITFGIFINSMCKCGRVDEALEMLKKMSGSKENGGVGIEPDAIIYNTLIDGLCKVGRLDEGVRLMGKMKQQQGCAPNTVTYTCLIDGLCKAGEIERGKKLFDEMDKEGVLPNVRTFNCLIGGTCRNGKISHAVELFQEMQRRGLKGDVMTYTPLITAFCNVNNIKKAMEIFDQMADDGCSPDAIVYYSLISGLSLAGQMDDASSVLSKMKGAGFLPDLMCYNTLIGGLCKKNKLDKVFKLIEEMEKAGIQADAVTYNTLISYFSKAGDMNIAHSLLRKMIQEGLAPTVFTYGAFIHAYCLQGDLDEAMKIFKGMDAASLARPNTVIYNTLIDSFCQNNNVEVALSLMDDMRIKGVKPNTTTYNSIFKALKERKMLEKVLETMDNMIKHACMPNYVTMEILTDWLSAVGETDKLKNFVQGYKVSTSAV